MQIFPPILLLNGPQTMDKALLKDELETYTPTEQTVISLWAEVLQKTPSLDDNFFAVGGDSMSMVTLEYRIYEDLGTDLPAGVILSAPTPRELASVIDAERRAHNGSKST